MPLRDDRYFSPDPAQKSVAQALYAAVAHLPLICPHGHVDPRMFADPYYSFGTPVDLLIIPDHYIYRMLYSQGGVQLEQLGIHPNDGQDDQAKAEIDHRVIWQLFADHFYLFRGTPTGMWLKDELEGVFGVTEKLTSASAPRIYDHIATQLTKPEYRPRALYERFNVEVLATTDAATDTLSYHQAIRDSSWKGQILPTFRPDAVVDIAGEHWTDHLHLLEQVSGISIHTCADFIRALEQRRAFFKSMGATATDHAAITPYMVQLPKSIIEAIFERALNNQLDIGDQERFVGHMLFQMARMSVEDGLVMQLHVGSIRDHNPTIYRRFGANRGADIPTTSEYTQNLRPLLDEFGNDPRLRLILFTLDETTYARELAPLTGHYPALRLGPPWWFYDSLNGIRRYFDQVIETAGLYNTSGFNDDTRAFPSIPARHDLWRRAAADWLAGLVVRAIIDEDDAQQMIADCAYGLARQAYRLE